VTAAPKARVRGLIDERIELIRSDRTAHELRLERLLPDLRRDFGGSHSDEEIRTAADAVLAEYQDAPVRSFVMTIADRRAREVLRAGGRAALAP
jgi:hypothetical protein